MAPTEVPPIRSKYWHRRKSLRPLRLARIASTRSSSARVRMPRTPPPSSDRMRLRPGTKRWRSRGRSDQPGDTMRLPPSARNSVHNSSNGPTREPDPFPAAGRWQWRRPPCDGRSGPGVAGRASRSTDRHRPPEGRRSPRRGDGRCRRAARRRRPPDGELAAPGAAELDDCLAARDAQHLVRPGMEMEEGMDAVAPAVAPAVRGECTLDRHRRIFLARERESGAINDERQVWIVRGLAIVFEAESLHVTHRRTSRSPTSATRRADLGLKCPPKEDRRSTIDSCWPAFLQPFPPARRGRKARSTCWPRLCSAGSMRKTRCREHLGGRGCTVMRYQIQLATSVDVAFLASVIDDDRDPWNGERGAVPWIACCRPAPAAPRGRAARDSRGTPTALWGVTPVSDDPDVGHLWMLACENFDNIPAELQSLSRLVFGEMLSQFLGSRTSSICARSRRSIAALDRLCRRAGRATVDANLHRIWIDFGPPFVRALGGRLPN